MRGTFRKRGSKWYFQVEWRDPETGKRIQKAKGGFRTKKEAEAACAEFLNILNNGKISINHETEFGKYVEEWIDSKKDSIRKSTYNTYKNHINRYILPQLGGLVLQKIRYEDIELFKKELLRSNDLSPRTVLDILKIIRTCLKNAVERGLIDKNPAAGVKLRSEKPKIEVWDEDEASKFLEVAKEDPLYIAFLLPLTTGLRQGEVLGLPWRYVDLDRGILFVRQTLSHDGKTIHDYPKTAQSVRSIMLPEITIEGLIEQKKKQIRWRTLIGSGWHESGLVVTTSIGTPVLPRNCLRSLHRLAKKAGVRPITFHALRHTFATLMLKNGENPKTVAEILGHSSVRITLDTYSHVLPIIHIKAAEKIDSIFRRNETDRIFDRELKRKIDTNTEKTDFS